MAITKIGTPELFDFSATNTALQLPTGDTASRPSAPSAGEWRFNSELKYVEYWDGGSPGAWRQIDTEAPASPDEFPSQNFNVNTYTGNGGTQTLDAKFNEAANFNGSSSLITLPSGLNPNNNFSWSFWVNFNSLTNYDTPIALQDTHRNYLDILANGTLHFYDGVSLNSPTGTVTTSTWYNVVITKSSSTGRKMYVNGSEVASDSSTTNSIGGSGQNMIGAYNSGSSTALYLDGKIDQVRFFNTALTAAQAEDLYTDETTTTAATLNFPAGAGCIAAYQLDGDASDVGGTYGGVTTDIGYTGLKFTPDLVWIKILDQSYDNNLYDTVRGADGGSGAADKVLTSNKTAAQEQGLGDVTIQTNAVKVVETTGSPSSSEVNKDGDNFVSWNFKAGGAPTATNSAGAGNVPTSGSVMIDGVASTAALAGTTAATKISANTKAGFSIVQFPATATSIQVAHGLTSAPDLIIWKNLSTADNWYVYQKDYSSPNAQYLSLNTDGSVVSNATNNFSSVTTTTFNSFFWGGAGSNDIISYCFHNIANYQKTGAYTGTNAPGNIISTEITSGDGGFEPALVMIKCLTGSNSNWIIFDNKRNSANPRTDVLKWDTSGTETTEAALNVTFTTNGFVLNGAAGAAGTGQINSSGETYIYLAIAADKDSSAPTAVNSFKTSLYTGNGATQNIYTPFAPDFTWLKERSGTQWHSLYDSIRGVGNRIVSNSSNAQNNDPNRLTSFNPNGFSIGTDGDTNTLNDTYVSWNWKAGGLPTINSDGTNITSIVSANQAAGFSIVKYTGIGSTASVGHGLGVAPTLILAKCLDITSAWVVYSVATGVDKFIELNDNTAATTASGYWGTSAPTASVFEVNNGNSNNNSTGNSIIAYCFANSTGYQQAGTYSGSSSSVTINFDGAGFNPSFVMIRRTNATGQQKDWTIFDQSLSGSTTMNDYLVPNSDAAEFTNSGSEVITATSTGFTIAGGVWDGLNASGGEYLYLAVK